MKDWEFKTQFYETIRSTALFEEIKTILQEARQAAYYAVNSAMLVALLGIGKRIESMNKKVTKEQFMENHY